MPRSPGNIIEEDERRLTQRPSAGIENAVKIFTADPKCGAQPIKERIEERKPETLIINGVAHKLKLEDVRQVLVTEIVGPEGTTTTLPKSIFMALR
jgi:hypothetical protein